MSLRAIPVIILPFILYNVIAMLGGGVPADDIFRKPLFSLPMLSGAQWTFSWSDLLILLTMAMLFIELIKSTYTASSSLIDHGLSMLVLIVGVVEFQVVNAAATSTFFFNLVGSLIDLLAGFTIGIRVARRDLASGGVD